MKDRKVRQLPQFLGALLGMAMITVEASGAGGGQSGQGSRYPKAPVSNTVEDYHGTNIPDPLRPLEDPDSAETKAWIEAQNKVTFSFLENIPARESIHRRLTALWDYERFGVPDREGTRYFYSYNSGLLNQSVLYWTEGLEVPGKVLLDPNTLSSDGTVALAGKSVSRDGRLMAYGLARAGSDWNEWKVRDIASGQDLPDHLEWIKFSGAEWIHDGKGFFYGRFPEPEPGSDLRGSNYFQKVYFHAIGTGQKEDRLVWRDDEQKEVQASPTVTDDGAYLILTLGRGTDNKYRVLVRKLEDWDAEPRHVVGQFDHDYTFIDNDGPVFYFRTDQDAPRGRIVAIDVNRPEPENWTEVVPEAAETLESADVVAGRLLLVYLKDARTLVKVCDLEGRFQREVELPGLGTAVGFSGKRQDSETFYAFTSATTPSTIYRNAVETGESSVWRQPELDFKPGDYVVRQVFYQSKDGTRIPMFLSHKKGLVPDGETPTLLYGYGGFNIAMTSSFSPSNLAWMEMGGIHAMPGLRGGGEYGEQWHQQGAKKNKQNVFDDFIAAAEYLIREGYTRSSRLAISGRSNGGLLVGACMTQRPDLFGACLPGVGVMDMLRFHKFTIGWAWVDDYGSPEDPELFPVLRAYSPLHNIKKGTCYPPTLITTADHDDRVVPAHSFKFAAAIQEAQGCSNPVLIRIETKAGHGAGKPTAKVIEEAADCWAFLARVLDIKLMP